MTHTDHDQLADAFGTPVGPGDHVTALGRPLEPALVLETDPAGGRLSVRAAGDRFGLYARGTRVVTVRDARGARLGDGDTVRGIDQPDDPDGPTWVIGQVHYAVGLVSLAGPDRRTTVTLPALLVRVGAAVSAGDQVVDDSGLLCVVLRAAGPDEVLVEPLMAGGPPTRRRRTELRRAVEARPGLQLGDDGTWGVPALDGDALAAADVDAILAGTWAPNIVPFPRAAG